MRLALLNAPIHAVLMFCASEDWGAFVYVAASGTFRPGGLSDSPPQENDAKCGLACHTVVKNRDYVFTEYGKR